MSLPAQADPWGFRQQPAQPAGNNDQQRASGPQALRWSAAFESLQLVERRWSKEIAPLASVALAAFLLYAVTAPRSVAFEDEGIFLMVLDGWGVSHLPGYPLYALLGSSFYHLLPSGIPSALRGHLFSALCAALACVAVYAIVIQLVCSRLAGVLAGLAAMLRSLSFYPKDAHARFLANLFRSFRRPDEALNLIELEYPSLEAAPAGVRELYRHIKREEAADTTIGPVLKLPNSSSSASS